MEAVLPGRMIVRRLEADERRNAKQETRSFPGFPVILPAMQALRPFAPAAPGLAGAVFLSGAGGGCARAAATAARIDVREREIEVAAVVHTSALDSGWITK